MQFPPHGPKLPAAVSGKTLCPFFLLRQEFLLGEGYDIAKEDRVERVVLFLPINNHRRKSCSVLIPVDLLSIVKSVSVTFLAYSF